MEEIKTKIRTFIVDNFFFGEADELDDEASFLDEGIIDSTGVLELVTFLEETYSIHVADDEMTPENLDSINQAAAYVKRKLVG